MYQINKDSDVIVVDVETTGTDPEKHAVVKIAVAVCDVMMNVRAKRVFNIRPHEGAIIEPKAMQVNGLTELEIMSYPVPHIALSDLNKFLFSVCRRSSRYALWYCWGVGFDDKFLTRTYKRTSVLLYAPWTWSCMRGIAVHLNLYASILVGREELETSGVAKFLEYLGEKFEGEQHDPMADVLNEIRAVKLSMARLMKAVQADTLKELSEADIPKIDYDFNKPCPHCGGEPRICNPTGKCDHIHYPEGVNKSLTFSKWAKE